MGLPRCEGIDKPNAVKLLRKYGLKWFVETGTYIGYSSKWASLYFNDVLTIEINQKFYNLALERLGDLRNVQALLGSSRHKLKDLISEINAGALFWLDAKYMAGKDTRDEEGPCPLLDDIRTINTSSYHHVIMFNDDYRYTGKDGWPALEEVMRTAKDHDRRRVIQNNGVFYAVPK